MDLEGNMTDIEDMLTISPEEWADKKLALEPGDLTRFVLQGIGISAPLVLRPWDDPSSTPENYYSYQPYTGDPMADAPINSPGGGLVYFDGTPGEEDVSAMLRIMCVNTVLREYAAFVGYAVNPEEERFLVQLRLVSRFALYSMFRAIDGEGLNTFPEQPLTVGEALWRFIVNQQERWGTGMDSPEISGIMGGDGDWAKESLSFGFMVENEHHGVYRIWSRAWLVTK